MSTGSQTKVKTKSPRRPSPKAIADSSSPLLRPYQASDFNTLWTLDQVCFSPEIAYTKYELEQFLEFPGAFTIVAEERGGIHGFILTHAHKKHGHIITIDVRDSHRRTGLGSLLLKASEDRLRELSKQTILLEVAVDNLSALTFYKRHGYSVLKTIPRYYSNGLDALEMAKSLGPA